MSEEFTKEDQIPVSVSIPRKNEGRRCNEKRQSRKTKFSSDDEEIPKRKTKKPTKKYQRKETTVSTDDEASFQKTTMSVRKTRRERFERVNQDDIENDPYSAISEEFDLAEEPDDYNDDDYADDHSLMTKGGHKHKNVQAVKPLAFQEYIVLRRAALGLLPDVSDPDAKKPFQFSPLKSSRTFLFNNSFNMVYINMQNPSFDGGYRLCRTTRGFKTPGKYYWELSFEIIKPTIEQQNDPNHYIHHESHVRFGIATARAEMEFPVGYDDRGYCVRDSGGAFHHKKELKNDCFLGFNEGDRVGFGLTIPEDESEQQNGKLEMWVNGEYRAIISDTIDCTKRWFPAVSIYFNCIVSGYFSTKGEKSIKFLPEGDWIPAEKAPFDYPKRLMTADTLIKRMKNFHLKQPDETTLRIISVALVPTSEMPY